MSGLRSHRVISQSVDALEKKNTIFFQHNYGIRLTLG